MIVELGLYGIMDITITIVLVIACYIEFTLTAN